jgi:putative tryptophan/tyrosine transport system substrate-binding protein
MDRRGFLLIPLAGALAAPLAAPLGAEAQPSTTISRIGLLTDLAWEPLREGLSELGYVEGRNIVFELRRSEGQSERWPALAAELVRLKVDVIVTQGTPATLAAKRATTTIPIVMVGTGDPLTTGLVASLARPRGNVTGSTQLGAGLATKRLEILKEAVPKVSRVAFLWNPANPDQKSHFHEVQTGARSLNVALQSVEVRSRGELEQAFTAMMRERPSALLMTADSVHQRLIDDVLTFASRNRLPAMYQVKENVERGGLMSYGASTPDLLRRAATYVDRILKGAKPADLPVEQPTKFELVINLKTAKALGLTIPPSLLARADQIIE